MTETSLDPDGATALITEALESLRSRAVGGLRAISDPKAKEYQDCLQKVRSIDALQAGIDTGQARVVVQDSPRHRRGCPDCTWNADE